MKSYREPSRSEWESICRRPSSDNPAVRDIVSGIINRVRRDGDKALEELSSEIDGFIPESLRTSEDEIALACSQVSEKVKRAVAVAAADIKAFHSAQMPSRIEVETVPGVTCIQKPVPISNVGLYIPGGTAPLFSTVLMLAIPAQIAGCSRTVLCTPAGKDGKIAPAVLYAAHFCGIKDIFKVGGAQAVAAMAFGTQSIPKVDKIFGPGNQFVTTAKQMLGGNTVAIDMPAGPSEVMVIADRSSDPSFAAADLLSQAEHGNDSQVVLVCNDEEFEKEVLKQIELQTASLGRKNFAENALSKSCAVIFSKKEDIIDFANCYAPEHLIISTADAWDIAESITAAGSVFVGQYTPESAGDYASGTNHTLPTCGWARSFSGVNIDSYMRKMTLQSATRQGLEALASTITDMAEAEGLQAHANAVTVRLRK